VQIKELLGGNLNEIAEPVAWALHANVNTKSVLGAYKKGNQRSIESVEAAIPADGSAGREVV